MGSMRQNIFGDLIAHLDEADTAPRRMILMVGDPQRMQMLKKYYPQRTGFFLIEFSDLTQDILNSIAPDCVVAPALCAQFDCLELADLLHRAGFRGSFRAIPKGLPRPDLIREEIASLYPSLDFDMLDLTPVQPVQIRAALH
ncbi:hypothetical protein [Celeribacter halophilus]|uniref:Response regulatory domain-containing protein n=1 Tax=Celeribacter halophilus TaxID=576117 RepID=A0A1I3TFB3_9RHOB|nr:hypothetical protein [Celeribacter halophilus]PZX11099.1 hypothetical protein LX82_02056 [Celeribacter halophilus]SFJ69310.1 hypothetical protein SAMN04488138_10890 [Celeribacter halophilus]